MGTFFGDNAMKKLSSLLIVFFFVPTLFAQEQYLIVPLKNLSSSDPALFPEMGDNNQSPRPPVVLPVVLDIPGSEAYLCRGTSELVREWTRLVRNKLPGETENMLNNKFNNNETYFVAKIRKPTDQKESKIFFRTFADGEKPRSLKKVVPFEYTIDWNSTWKKESEKNAQTVLILARAKRFERLLTRSRLSREPSNYTGKPVFQSIFQESYKELDRLYDLEKRNSDFLVRFGLSSNIPRSSSLVRTYDLLSGGRAIEQNIELNSTLNILRSEKRTVELSGIEGISIAEIDWDPYLENLEPTELDRLAKYVPSDQHIVVFPTFASAYKIAKLTEQSGLPVLQSLQYRETSNDFGTFAKYQKQLALSLDGVVEKLGPSVIRSLALTGGDFYFPSGTDLTILFETNDSKTLQMLLSTQIAVNLAKEPKNGIEKMSGKIGETAYAGFQNADRTVSTFLAVVDENTVAVSNSIASLTRVVETVNKKNESLADLKEYRFFRDRYKLGDASESAYAFLSDATIRRWCGPRWRIAASRRLQQQVVIGSLQAQNMKEILDGTLSEPKDITPPSDEGPIMDEFKYTLARSGVRNSVYGSYTFLTPIAELPVSLISDAERNAYEQWKADYEGRWRRSFDPIGIRLTLDDKKMGTDITIMPLNVRTNREYERAFGFSVGGEFAEDQSQYGCPFQLMVSLNPESEMFRRQTNFVGQMVQGVSLGWVGKYVSVFFDEGPFWDEIRDWQDKNPNDSLFLYFLRGELKNQIPIALEVESTNSLKLAAFMMGLRTTATQSSPDTTLWETLQYRDVSFVKVSPAEKNSGVPDNFAIYYTTSGGKLFITLNEKTLQRMIDKRLGAAETEEKPTTVKPWLGKNIALRVNSKAIPFLDWSYDREMFSEKKLAQSAELNVPIMDVYRSLFPDKDPIAVHEKLWGERISCPAEGTYRWNEKYRTYDPVLGPIPKHSPMINVDHADFGVTFEEDGIRARVEIELK